MCTIYCILTKNKLEENIIKKIIRRKKYTYSIYFKNPM